jgi:hypothetical protein
VGFTLGEQLIAGDIAVGGTYVDIEIAPSASGGRSRLMGDEYVELRVDGLLHNIAIEGDSARWSMRLVDGATVMCWLSVGESALDHASITRPEHQG